MKDQADVVKRMSGDASSNQAQQVTIYPNPGDPSRPVYSHFYWTIPTASLPDNVPTSQLNATPYHETFSFYLQDTLTLLPNLTISLGLRYDNQQIFSGDGTRQINITDSWAPRIGFAWDPDEGQQDQGLRLVRLLLRADPDGPRHPVLQLGAPAHDLQLRSGLARPGRRRPPRSSATTARSPRAAARSSAGSTT